jgi:hypothetical protein
VLILCGGFSENHYLRSRVRKRVQTLNTNHQNGGAQGQMEFKEAVRGLKR